MATPDFFRSRIETMIDLGCPLAVLARRLPWSHIELSLAANSQHKDRAGRSHAGRPRLSTRLLVSLVYLKHSFNLSDEEVCQRWSENIVWQYFSGQEYYEHRLPCDATQIGRFRRLVGEEGLEELLNATIDSAVQMRAVKPQELQRVIVDSRLLEIARHKVVSAAKRAGITCKQTYAKEGKLLRRKAGGYGHAKQFRRLKRTVKRQRTTRTSSTRCTHPKLSASAKARHANPRSSA